MKKRTQPTAHPLRLLLRPGRLRLRPLLRPGHAPTLPSPRNLPRQRHLPVRRPHLHLKAGDAFLIRPMDSIYYRADNTDPWSYAWAGFDGSACKEILEQTIFSDTPIFTPETPSRQNSSSPTCKAYLTPFPKTTETTSPSPETSS